MEHVVSFDLPHQPFAVLSMPEVCNGVWWLLSGWFPDVIAHQTIALERRCVERSAH